MGSDPDSGYSRRLIFLGYAVSLFRISNGAQQLLIKPRLSLGVSPTPLIAAPHTTQVVHGLVRVIPGGANKFSRMVPRRKAVNIDTIFCA